MNTQNELLEALRSSLKDVDRLRRTNQELVAASTEPIAVVGIGCRFPGGVSSAEDLWQLVAAGIDAVADFPADRGWAAPVIEFARQGGFLDHATEFDAEFFGISPREALAMDPQQRVMLEVSWEALERAGIDPSSLRGSRTGVFTGCSSQDYMAGLNEVPAEVAGHVMTGNSTAVISGRVAFSLGLEGPAVTVDTACSSSLVALHLAVESLRRGESRLALAGGVTVLSTPTVFAELSRQGGLAADGRCKAFSAAADGTGWGEGAGVLVLQRLSDARRDGREVLAIVRGSAVNQDGASNGLTAPNGPSQQRVIRQALVGAGLSVSDVDAVEAHGTGTALGDPIEAQALLATYGQDRDVPLWLGSVKSNLGHTQAAAGVAGVTKMVMAMRHGVLPRTLHVDEPTPHVDWASGGMRLLAEAMAWPETGRPRRAGVSSFGISGTNAHVILEHAATEPRESTVEESSGPVPWLLSAHTAEAVRAQADRLLTTVTAEPGLTPAAVAHALLTQRATHIHRMVVHGGDRAALTAGLAAIRDGRPAENVVTGTAVRNNGPVFVFPGQGAQWLGMGVELAEHFPVFASRLAECGAALAPWVDWPLADALTDKALLTRVDVVQPALWAIMVSLAELWRSLGVIPAAVVGHSQGEIAAACVAGALSLADGARVVALRGKLLRGLSGGGMLSVLLPVDQVEPLVAEWPGRLSLAAVNGPASVVVSGDGAALTELMARCTDQGVRVRRIDVDYASHSTQVESVRDDLVAALDGIEPRATTVPLLSTVTGDWVDGAGLDAGYWYRNLREPVRFADAVRGLIASEHRVFLENSPHPVLALGVQETADQAEADVTVVGTLRRDDGGRARVLTSMAELHVRGVTVDWSQVVPAGSHVDLPTYPFERKRFWLADTVRRDRGDLGAPGLTYRVDWRPLALEPTSLPGEWLAVVTPDASVWRDRLLDHGATITTVESADALMARLREPAGFTGILCDLPADGVLTLLRAMAERGITAPLWCLTTGAVTVGNTTADPVQAEVWGLGRVAAVEFPELWGGLVDLPTEWHTDTAGQLSAVLTASGGEDQVAIRGSGVLARRLVRHEHEQPETPWQPAGAVLVACADGATANAVAQWVTDLGAEHVEVTGEVTDRAALTAVLTRLADAGTPVSTAFYGPAPAALEALGDLDAGELAGTVATAVAGAALLDELLDRASATLVLFTSIAGVWGSAGHGVFAAVNAHLDALAEKRRARGVPATTLAWGLWHPDGEVSLPPGATAERVLGHGVHPLDPRRGFHALRTALGWADASVVVADVDWPRFTEIYTAARPSPLVADLASGDTRIEPDEHSALALRLAAMGTGERRRALLEIVRAEAAAALRYPDVEGVRPDRPFRELGLDSLTAVELRNRLAASLGVRLPTTVVFDHPTARALVDHLLDLLGPHDGVAADRPTVAAADDDPVVIVAMACRFPGGVRSPEDLWQVVAHGRDVVSGFPVDRGWDLDRLADPGSAVATHTREGGFLHDAPDFDAAFFGINPREALAMDPQQRLLLETSWEVIERAGIDPLSLDGQQVGVYVGSNVQDYAAGLVDVGGDTAGYVGTGHTASVMSGRIAYVLGLAGPAVTVDTACSSSLVALHLAAQALRSGECALALAGGVAVMSSPTMFIEFSRQRGLAPDGRCKAFAAAADGTGMSEGVGMLLVERLSDARRNGHEVLAVVRGSAVNSDGASNGLTAPNGLSQQRVIRRALASAGLSPADVDAVEGHGTGTTLGDPIEAQALIATYGQDRDEPLWLGSLKSNMGHAQAAAGVAGVVKMVQAMRHGVLPRTLHVDEPTPHVDWSAGAVRLLTEAVEWPASGRPRRAGVSSFGISGTNAHVVLEQPPELDRPDTAPDEPRSLPAVPWLLAARDERGLRAQARALLARLADDQEPAAVDVAFSLATTRTAFDHRAVVVGRDRADLVHGLEAFASGHARAAVTGSVSGAPVCAAVFSGQGSQRLGMGRELCAFPEFARELDEVCAPLDAGLGRSLREVIWGDDPGVVDQTLFAQAGLFAVEVALFRLLESWGVPVDAVSGHSIGEVAAAHVAGVLSLEDAARLVVARGTLMQALPAGGAMISVAAPLARVEQELAGRAGAGIAAVNGPSHVVVSGVAAEVLAVADTLAGKGFRTRRLQVSHAFHSLLMEPMLDEFAAALADLTFAEPRIPLVSTVSADADPTSAAHWVRQVREPVRFADAVRGLRKRDISRFIEIGPGSALTVLAQDCLAGEPRALAVAALRGEVEEPRSLVEALARLHVHGVGLDWAAFFTGARRVDLPTFAFQRERFWADAVSPAPFEPAVSRDAARWRYRVGWTPVEASDRPLGGTWLVVAPVDATPWAVVLGDRLAAGGARVVPVPFDDSEPTRERLAELVSSAAEPASVEGVVSLLGMDERPLPGFPAVPAGLAATMALVQATADLDLAGRVWSVTRGAVSTVDSADLVNPTQAQIWGLGRVAALEHPRTWGGLIDVPAEPADELARLVVAALGGPEDQVAVRDTGLLARRLRRAPVPPMADAAWDPADSTVLVTGGTGALGAHVARWLADRGARRLILVGRQTPDRALTAGLDGVDVVVVACDVADRAAVSKLVADNVFDAVVHCAGVVDDGLLASLDPARFQHVLAAKAAGAAHLDELTRDRTLSAFVTFSSIAGVLGARGQANYAAANAYVDALVLRRRAAGLAGTSVAWGAWDGAGMATRLLGADAAEQLKRRGQRPLDPRLAVTALAQALDRNEDCLVLADIDWARFAPLFTLGRPSPLLDDLPETGDQATREDGQAPVTGSPEDLGRVPAADRQQTLVDLVRRHTVRVLGHHDLRVAPATKAFKELGFDSMTAVELRNSLSAATGVSLTATSVFDWPTPAELAEHLRTELFGADEPHPVLAEVDRLAATLATATVAEPERAEITARLREMAARWSAAGDGGTVADSLDTASDDEVFDFLKNEFGIS